MRNNAKDYSSIVDNKHLPHLKDVYVSLNDQDYRVEFNDDESSAIVTETSTGKVFNRDISNYDLDYQTIIRADVADSDSKKSNKEIL